MRIKTLLIASLLNVLFLEIASFFVLIFGLVPDLYSQRGITAPKHIYNQGIKWRTEEQDWGGWHRKNFKDKHTKSCFNVEYESNNFGARDSVDYHKDFPNNSIIALGDSFIEGYGLNHNDTFSFNLEKISGRKVYNLGTALNTGPLQYYLIYKNFAKLLNHDTVVIGFLPANDFYDNDIDTVRYKDKKVSIDPKRRRPYYDTTNSKDNYPILYPNNSKKRSKLGRYGIKNLIAGQSIRINLVRLYKNIILIKNFKVSETIPSYYDSWSIEQQDAALHYIKKLYYESRKNKVKKFIVLGIPNQNDFSKPQILNNNRIIPRWEKLFIDFQKENQGFIFVDGFKIDKSFLNEDDKKNISNYLFLKCDGHWTKEASKVYSNLINSYF